MSQVIRIALVTAAIIAVVALLMPVFEQIGAGVNDAASAMASMVNSLSQYLTAGRAALNLILGYPVLVDICLWLAICAPISVEVVKFGIYLYSKIIG